MDTSHLSHIIADLRGEITSMHEWMPRSIIPTQIYKFEPSLCFLRGKVNSFIRESTNLQSLGDDWWLAADGGLAYRVDILEAEHEISVLSLKLSCISRKLFSVPEYVNSASATAGRAAAQLDDMAKAIQKSMVTAHGVIPDHYEVAWRDSRRQNLLRLAPIRAEITHSERLCRAGRRWNPYSTFNIAQRRRVAYFTARSQTRC